MFCRSLLLIACAAACAYSLKLTEKRMNDALTITLVHDGDDAMLSHKDAREFCRNLNEKKKQYTLQTNTTGPMILPASGTAGTLLIDAPNVSEDDEATHVFNDLLSLHSPGMVAELMQWILSVERHQFWIGGIVKKVVRPFEDHSEHIIHMWTDHTPTNFRFLHFPNKEIRGLAENEVKCLSVDYASGKWGVHDCKDKMYFVCETVIPPHMMKPTIDTTTSPMSTTATRRTEVVSRSSVSMAGASGHINRVTKEIKTTGTTASPVKARTTQTMGQTATTPTTVTTPVSTKITTV